MMEIGGGKYALAISDGMGNGERAHYESKETLKLLQKFYNQELKSELRLNPLTLF